MGVQQLEEAWAARTGAREARLVAALHVPAALSLLGIVRPGDRLVAFADDFADAFASGFDGCDVVMVGSRLSRRLLRRPVDLPARLMPRGRTCGGSSTPLAGLVCVCPIFVLWVARLARHARCSW